MTDFAQQGRDTASVASGHAAAPRRYSTAEEAFAARTVKDGDCLVWTGATMKAGYGVLKSGGKQVGTHRYAWERVNGTIPEGMVIDHKCWNKACVKIEHLRLATPSENSQNKRGAQSGTRSGLRGVYWHQSTKKWQVRAIVGGQLHIDGYYPDLVSAGKAARELRKRVMPYAQG